MSIDAAAQDDCGVQSPFSREISKLPHSNAPMQEFEMTSFIASLFHKAAHRLMTVRMLALDDHLLDDIGISRYDLQAELRRKGQ